MPFLHSLVGLGVTKSDWAVTRAGAVVRRSAQASALMIGVGMMRETQTMVRNRTSEVAMPSERGDPVFK